MNYNPNARELPAEVAFELSRLRLAEKDHDFRGRLRLQESITLDRYMRSLRIAGWTLQAISDEMDLTRERVRQRTERDDLPYYLLPEVPEPAAKPAKPRKARGPRIKPDVIARMRALIPLARKARAGRRNPQNQEASRELARIMAALVEQGIPMLQIARACSISMSAVRFRLARFGYRSAPPSYQQDNVTFLHGGTHTPNDVCAQGHPLTGNNLRVVQGNGRSAGLRVCRTCERRRSADYRKRKAAAS